MSVTVSAAAAAAEQTSSKHNRNKHSSSSSSRITVCLVAIVLQAALYDEKGREEGRMLGERKRGRGGIRDDEERGGKRARA